MCDVPRHQPVTLSTTYLLEKVNSVFDYTCKTYLKYSILLIVMFGLEKLSLLGLNEQPFAWIYDHLW